MPEHVTPLRARRDEAGTEGPDELSEMRAELARQEEEILRLRDLLIGKDAELGAVRGRLAELEDHSVRFLIAVRRLQSRVPRLAWLLNALRRLTSRG